jgi:hypothetical protein
MRTLPEMPATFDTHIGIDGVLFGQRRPSSHRPLHRRNRPRSNLDKLVESPRCRTLRWKEPMMDE